MHSFSFFLFSFFFLLLSFIRVGRPAHLIILDLVTLNKLGEEIKL
jgi:hypothetical protein